MVSVKVERRDVELMTGNDDAKAITFGRVDAFDGWTFAVASRRLVSPGRDAADSPNEPRERLIACLTLHGSQINTAETEQRLGDVRCWGAAAPPHCRPGQFIDRNGPESTRMEEVP